MVVQIPLFMMHKQLKSLVKPAVDRAISELLMPVVDRSIKIALTTCESIIKKVTVLGCLLLPTLDRMMVLNGRPTVTIARLLSGLFP